MRVTAKITGMDRLLKKLDQYPDKVKKLVSEQMHLSAENMVEGAVNDAPHDMGLLKAEITFKKVDDLNYEVVSQADYSAFVEFGTRSKVQIPAGFEQIASQFKGAKSSGDAKKMIYAWCKRVGVPEDGWYPIYREIMTNGIKPHPFFFKQIAKERPNLIKNIKRELKNGRRS